MPTKRQKDLLNELGPEYTIKVIDKVECIYRKIGDKYDLEIAGTQGHSKKLDVYIWDISSGLGHGARIVERVLGIKAEGLKIVLDELVAKYQD